MGDRRGVARKARFARVLAGFQPPVPEDRIEQMITRARRLRSAGDVRQAIVLLRRASALDEWRARTWALLGALLAGDGRTDEARAALGQAAWLRRRAGDKVRALVIEAFAARIASPGLDAAVSTTRPCRSGGPRRRGKVAGVKHQPTPTAKEAPKPRRAQP